MSVVSNCLCYYQSFIICNVVNYKFINVSFSFEFRECIVISYSSKQIGYIHELHCSEANLPDKKDLSQLLELNKS